MNKKTHAQIKVSPSLPHEYLSEALLSLYFISQAVPVTKEYEMESLRAHNSELEEELHSVKDKLAELEEKNTLLTAEKENLKKERQSLMDKMVEKDEEIAKKAKDVAEKSADYTSLHVEKEELEIKVQKLAEENELLKSHLQVCITVEVI